MEVGAVKQAFNNEVILLKKNLNQAKIHVIHKLTRKAKTLTEKKTPEHLKEKLKRKAESAINEVLIIKKIKAKDIAKFIITHTGEIKDYLNRPKVDNEKACARLVLHKSLQDKYKFIRSRFGNVPIKDLFMSRQERRKLKKEAREKQSNKKKGKENKLANAAGVWDVVDVEMGSDSKDITQNDIDSDDEGTGNENEHSETERNKKSSDENDSEIEDEDDVENSVDENQENTHSGDEAVKNIDTDDEVVKYSDNNNDELEVEVGKYIKLKPEKKIEKQVGKSKTLKTKNHAKIEIPEINTFDSKSMDRKIKEKIQTDRKVKENKNKNLKEKLQSRKFKKGKDDAQIEGRKVVDPFFKTASGENYMSLAEPRQPDEVKEVHKQGNRQERRAAMFGHVAKFKPRRDDFRQNNFRTNKFDREDGLDSKTPAGVFRNKNDRLHNNSDFNGGNGQFNERNAKFKDRNGKSNDGKFNDKSRNDEKIDEKLHPSWEAKRKLKSAMSLLPFQGKKIVFENN